MLGGNGDIQSYDLFAYCSNDPINHSDPTGKGIFGDFARSFYDVWIKPYVDRNSAMFNDPNLFNIGNWLTCGFFDTVKGAIAPQKPLSLQHWVDSFCVASVVMGPFIANAGRGARAAKSASATTKSIGTSFDPKGAKVQVGVDPNTLKINRPLLPAKMEAIRREAQAYGGINRAVEVWRSGVIYDGNHRVAYAQQIGATVDVIIFPQ